MNALLAEVKQYLHIDWDSDDDLLAGYIHRGQARLQKIAGGYLNFHQEGLAKSLLLDYCRYANSQALEVFEKNFESELVELHMSGMLDGDEDED